MEELLSSCSLRPHEVALSGFRCCGKLRKVLAFENAIFAATIINALFLHRSVHESFHIIIPLRYSICITQRKRRKGY